MAEAQRVTIGIGQTMSDLNMALMPARTARVTGTAVDSQGRPMMGMVMVVPLGDSMIMMFGSPGQIKADGSFAIGGLAPGSYRLQTMNGPGDTESGFTEVSINGDDINGIRLVGAKPSTASGRIIVDAAAAPALKPSLLRVMAQPAVFDGMMMGPPAPPAQVNDDLTFELKSRPGKMRLAFGGTAVGWSIRAVRYRGVDVTDSGIDFKPNEDIADVEIEITNRVTDLSGLVTNSRGAPVKDYSIAVFPQDRDKWTPGSRYFRSGRPDQDGRFKLTSLVPGEYYVIALDYMDPSEWTEPEFLERIRTKATRLSIGEGVKRNRWTSRSRRRRDSSPVLRMYCGEFEIGLHTARGELVEPRAKPLILRRAQDERVYRRHLREWSGCSRAPVIFVRYSSFHLYVVSRLPRKVRGAGRRTTVRLKPDTTYLSKTL